MTKEVEARKLKKLYQAVEAARGLSHPKMAKSMGTDKSQISHMLNGRNPINLERGLQFCSHIGCELEDFSPRLAREASNLVKMVTGTVNGITGDVGYLVGTEMKEILEIIKNRVVVDNQIYWPGKHSMHTYALPVNGEANDPELPHGCTAIVDFEKEPKVGDMMALSDKTLKYARYKGDGFCEFVNKDYPKRVFKMPKKMSTVGVVIGTQIHK